MKIKIFAICYQSFSGKTTNEKIVMVLIIFISSILSNYSTLLTQCLRRKLAI